MTDEYEVIIVGAGPVGLSFGNLLGQAGVSTLILEANAGLTADPRAVHFDGEVMRIFQAMGLSDRVAEISLPVPEMNFTDEHDETLFSVNWGPGRGPQGWTPANLFHQPDLEGVLREGLQRWPSVTVGFGATVTAMTQNNGTVEVVAAGETYRASYLVGCDGAGSFTRKSIGSDWIPLGPAQPWVVADGVLLTDRGVLPQWPTQHPWPERPHFFMRNVDDRVRWEFKIMPGDDPEAIAAPDSVERMISPMVDPADVDVQRIAKYTFRSLVASSWHVGRVFLAGDAAHLQPPFMAQGMCSGIRDAANLSWKLVRALRAGETALLDTYEVERKPHAQAWIEEATRVSELCQMIDATSADERNELLRESGGRLVPILPSLGHGVHFGTPSEPVGELSDQLYFDDGRSLDDEAGQRYLLLLGTGADSPESTSAVFVASADSSAAVAGQLESQAAIALLVRPDRYFAGVARNSEELGLLLAELPTR